MEETIIFRSTWGFITVPSYRYGGEVTGVFFAPAAWVDKQVRPKPLDCTTRKRIS